MSPRTGRPPSADPRSEVVTVRLTKNELKQISADAKRAKKPISVWMRLKALGDTDATPPS